MSETKPLSDTTEKPLFELRDPNFSADDVETLMQRIRGRIRERSQAAEKLGRSYQLPGNFPASKRLPGNVYGAMERLRAASGAVSVHLSVVGQNRVPVIGGLLQKTRRAIHQLILYYVSMLAGRQSAFNRTSIEMNHQTILALEAALARIEKLEQEISLLRLQSDPRAETSKQV